MLAMQDPMPPATKGGIGGRAWRYDLDAWCAKSGTPRDQDCTVAGWLIEAPWAHPLWHSYQLSLVHLRPMPGFPAPIIHLAGATHELVLFALNPDFPREPVLTLESDAHILTPVNYAGQFIASSDAEADSRVEGAVGLIMSGELSPDTDFQRQWEALFGNEMIKPEWRAT